MLAIRGEQVALVLASPTAIKAVLTEQMPHLTLHHGCHAVVLASHPAQYDDSAIGPRYPQAFVHNVGQVQSVERTRAEDNADSGIGQRPWRIPVGLQQERRSAVGRATLPKGGEHAARQIKANIA